MSYEQFIDSQRYQIESYLKAGFSQTKIARILDVNKSTISRELKRNSKKLIMLNLLSLLVKDVEKKLINMLFFDTNMKRYIDHKLKNYQWLPEQIKGRCYIQGIAMVSVERIYQYIYSNQSQGGLLYKHLRTARRWRGKPLNTKHKRG